MKFRFLVLLLTILFFSFGCGDKNFFEWAHQDGSNKSVEALTADADAAMANKEYAKAAKYYSEVLQKEPSNSLARYGRARANTALAGINMSEFFVRVLDFVDDDAVGESSLSTSLEDPVLESVDLIIENNQELLLPFTRRSLQQFYEKIDIIIADYKYITNGYCDGVIDQRNPNLNINFVFLMFLQAAMFILDSNANGEILEDNDIIKMDNIKGDYSLIIPEGIDTYADAHPKFEKQLRKAILYIIGVKGAARYNIPYNDLDEKFGNWEGAVDHINIAIQKAGASEDSSILADLRDEFNHFTSESSSNSETEFIELWETVNS
ncbi:MAG: hypothetical protein GY817_01945 [bacterium]|nr:hypothetical protein [bacterium]